MHSEPCHQSLDQGGVRRFGRCALSRYRVEQNIAGSEPRPVGLGRVENAEERGSTLWRSEDQDEALRGELWAQLLGILSGLR